MHLFVFRLLYFKDKTRFRRAFAAASMQDILNVMTILVVFPLEYATHFLEILTNDIVPEHNHMSGDDNVDESSRMDAVRSMFGEESIENNNTIDISSKFVNLHFLGGYSFNLLKIEFCVPHPLKRFFYGPYLTA